MNGSKAFYLATLLAMTLGSFACLAGADGRKTNVMIFFDTEDFTSPRSAQGIYDLAEAMDAEGVTANFAVVGKLAEALELWGRKDIIKALSRHSVQCHTYGHSVHPTQTQIADENDYPTADCIIREQESKWADTIKRIFGKDKFAAFVPPGDNEPYVAQYIYRDMGMTFTCGMSFCPNDRGDLWYCGMLQVPYAISFEEFMPRNRPCDPKSIADRLAKAKNAVIYCHPNRVYVKECWDLVNYRGKNPAPGEDYVDGKTRWTPAQREQYVSDIRKTVRYLKNDPRIRLVTADELAREIRRTREPITMADVPMIQEALTREFGPVDAKGWCLTDVFRGVVCLLRGETSYLPRLEYGFLERPVGVSQRCSVAAKDMKAAAAKMSVEGFLPAAIDVGGTTVGPRDFLMAALQVLATGAEKIDIEPNENQLGSFAGLPGLEKKHYGGPRGWPVYPKELKGDHVTEMARLQVWTLRKDLPLPEATPDTLRWQAAIDAASAAGGGVVNVPAGEYVVGSLMLKSGVELHLEKGARLLGAIDDADYVQYDNPKGDSHASVVWAVGVSNVAVTGEGTIDGRGGLLERRINKPGEKTKWRQGRNILYFQDCKNVRVEGVTLTQPSSWTCFFRGCDGVVARKVTIYSHCNTSNDGFDVESKNVLIEDCDVDSEDDSLAIKSREPDRVVENVTVRRCRFSTVAEHIKFGTETPGVIRHVRVSDCQVGCRTAPKYRNNWLSLPGVQTKTAGLSAIEISLMDGGRLEDVEIRDITIGSGVITPICIRYGNRTARVGEGESWMKDIVIENVKSLAPSESSIACSITGTPSTRPRNITLRNVDLLFKGGGRAKDAAEVITDERERNYPVPQLFRSMLPAYGFYIRHVDGLVFENVKTTCKDQDEARPAVVVVDAPGFVNR